MKKLLSILTVVAIVLSMGTIAFAEETNLQKDYDALTRALIMETQSADATLLDNLTLPSQGANGSTITWSSDNTAVLSNKGVVTRGETMQNVNLTATITNSGESLKKTFSFRVPDIFDKNYPSNVVLGYDDYSTVTRMVDLKTSTVNGGSLNIASSAGLVAASYLTEQQTAVKGNYSVELYAERTSRAATGIEIWGPNNRHLYLHWNYDRVYAQFKNSAGAQQNINIHSFTDPDNLYPTLGSATKLKVRVDFNTAAGTFDLYLNDKFIVTGCSIYDNINNGTLFIAFRNAEAGVDMKVDYLKVTSLESSDYGKNIIFAEDFSSGVVDTDLVYCSNSMDKNGTGAFPALGKDATPVIENGLLLAGNGDIISVFFDENKRALTEDGTIVDFDFKFTDSNKYGSGIVNVQPQIAVCGMTASGEQHDIFVLQMNNTSDAMQFFHKDATGNTAWYYDGLSAKTYNFDPTAPGSELNVKVKFYPSSEQFEAWLNGIQISIGGRTRFSIVPTSNEGKFDGVTNVRVFDRTYRNVDSALDKVICYTNATAVSADETSMDYNAFDKKVNVVSPKALVGDSRFILAAYNDEAMTKAVVIETPVIAAANTDTLFDLNEIVKGNEAVLKGADRVSLFLLQGGTIKPLCTNLEINAVFGN